ncbi:S-layer protein, partial [Methanosalsum natronophilum]
VVIEGIWQISDDGIDIDTDDKFGKMKVTNTDGQIEMELDTAITLRRDSKQHIMESLYFRVSDYTTATDGRFYLMQEITTPGTYEVRGTIAVHGTTFNWTATGTQINGEPASVQGSFAGFWYDLGEDKHSEILKVDGTGLAPGSRSLEDDKVKYIAIPQNVTSEQNFNGFEHYAIIGFLAEEYVPVFTDGPLVDDKSQLDGIAVDKLSKLLMDTDDKWTLRVGQSLELEEGYSLVPKQIDVDGKKVWLELNKDGEYLDDKIIDVGSADTTWLYDQTVLGEDDIITLAINIEQVFQGTVDSLVVIEGIWQISDDGIDIDTDDKFGKMKVTNTDGQIEMELDSTLTLRRDSKQHLMSDIYFRVADDTNEVRFYPFVERTVGEPVDPV